MTTAIHPLIIDSPELAQDLLDLCDDDPKFTRQANEYEQLVARLSNIQSGAEAVSAETAELLEQQRNALKAILLRKLTHPAGGCCGGCGG